MGKVANEVCFCATGNELTLGDTLDTNSPYMAQRLLDRGIQSGMHLVVSDLESDIVDAMKFLLNRHQVMITIGGLGPTSDDRTRFALAKILGEPLEFHEGWWREINRYMTNLGLKVVDSNRQQCLFPKSAEIIANPNGTAAACFLHHDDRLIFMLPGPPNECLPIFDKIVLPKLAEQKNLVQFRHLKSWLLWGVVESDISQKLDPLVENIEGIEIGYRVSYPYLEVKLLASNKEQLEKASEICYEQIKEDVISDQRKMFSQQLQEFLLQNNLVIAINDQATCGYLQTTLTTPDTFAHLIFCSDPDTRADVYVEITGLNHYWYDKPVDRHHLSITLSKNHDKKIIEKTVPHRKQKSLIFAVEIICAELLAALK